MAPGSQKKKRSYLFALGINVYWLGKRVVVSMVYSLLDTTHEWCIIKIPLWFDHRISSLVEVVVMKFEVSQLDIAHR